MEEKKHPIFEEEENVGMVSEPVATTVSPETQSADVITEDHDWIDDLDWDKFPILGPKTEEEAMHPISKKQYWLWEIWLVSTSGKCLSICNLYISHVQIINSN